MSEIIQIKELDINSIRPNVESMKTDIGGMKIAIIGKPSSGKSVLIKHLLYAKKHLIPVGMVISGSEDSNGFYSKIFPQLFIYEKYKKDVVKNFIERQKLSKKYHLPNSWSVLVMDDCMDDVKVFNDPLIQGLFKNGRHWNMLALFANQYVLDFKPAIRTNLDGIFIFREPNNSNREKIYKNFASVIPTFKIFCHLMDKLTVDYTSIYIKNQLNNTRNEEHWTNYVFYFKAQIVPDFTFGCDDYIRFSEDRIKEEED
ncbi:032R [Cherax quadricarinatus iridovirus]|uniref:ATpase 3 n=1 Tax=Shrimp hemocyte iridescent virus TaxID=2039780 RepID=A0A291B0W2_9VIRU|nr:032R [Cherax quadricarinatus iridovirus]YP_010084871.1 ATpase 3 [Shrimp hemocyte iridescent virus]UPA43351.1 ATpase 3 [Iridovirus CN01]ASZ85012.1 032R [Cherax quadricarinatus iridovirus]ATE87128.1 ATpase 3 [Shrimp hemocyte iridescent virus]UPA43586.1 ATpase 3 [Iridovirus CN01]UPA43621.1 ATpase 3 [Iridovirus CN01]